MRVLLVSRYRPLAKPLARALAEEGYTVDVVPDEDEGQARARTTAYAAILLDVLGTREAGLSLVRDWRGAGLNTPVLVLASPGSDDPVGGPDSEIEDWLNKPFELDALFARLRDLVRRTS